MVCRENKGRSAVIGYQKHLLRQLGFRDYDDFELQSGIHEFGHQYEGFPKPTEKEQLQFLKGLKQQIESDPRITAADKYRESDKQPGMVTRIDQEIARLKTGKDEHGRPLQSKHKMRGQDLAAMQRLGVLLQRNQEAKDGYFDVYARSMGVDAKTARARWKELVRRQKSERENTRVSLTDSWRDNLAVSGFTSRHQADLGQSNVSREALRIMEEERRAKLASLPTRPTITSAQRVRMAEPGQSTVQCTGQGGCGQFGHERSACPNEKVVQDRDNARARWKDIDAKIRAERERADEHARNDWAYIASYSHKEMAQMREERDLALKYDQQATHELAASGPQGAVRCGTCQQFGHESGECPNPSRVDELNDLRDKVNQYYDRMDTLSDWISAAEDEVPADDPELKRWRQEYGNNEFFAQQAVGQYRDKKAEIATAAVRCEGGCGQFGHVREECPNAALLDEVAAHVQEAEKIGEQIRHRAQLRGQNPDKLTEADHELYDDWFAKSVDIDKRLLAAGIDPHQVSTGTALSQAKKPSGPASARIQEVGYNADTGYLEVTTRPYTRKSDGKVMPAKTYAYRMSPSEHQQMMAASSLTSYVSQSVWAKNGANAAYQFENVAEAAEASVQRKCPTCGRWASMTSAHTCPVPGSRAGQDDSARRAWIKAEKQAARAVGRPVQMPPQMTTVALGARLRFGNNTGTLDYADRKRIDAALASGKVAAAEVRASFLDANVTGKAIAWNDADGQAKLSTDREDGATLQCTCRAFKKDGTCKHVRVVGAAMASRYAADHPAVGSPLRAAPLPAPKPTRDETAKDAPEEGFARMTYAQIRQRRADLRGKERDHARRSSAAGDGQWLRAAGAVDGVTGKRVKTPQAWTERGISADPADSSASGAVRLDQAKDVQDGLRAGLRSNTGKHWSVTCKPDGWLHITTALQRRTSDREITMPERIELAKALKMPVHTVSAHGVSIPPDNGWRAEFLDRAHGKNPRVLGERFVARADQRHETLLNI
ncbi:hypothetical protein ABZ502_34190 [Streptomyces abikoensis]|uniref:hypothetical protein n=1 Tax=Streptomyces abikoensis TaxID=97398 RepID=UPI0033F95CCB